ncbi:MAG: efflux RND transporter permease subunit [Gemmataceae bacterium]
MDPPAPEDYMFSRFFIDRPIGAAMLSVAIVILGIFLLLKLPIAQYPEVVPPTVQVSAIYPGANAKVVAETVATPIEQEINGVENMLYMSSLCTNDGQLYLNVTFELGTDLNMAQVLVQNRVAIAEAKLPEEVRRQGVTTKKKSPSILLCVNLISQKETDAQSGKDHYKYDQLYLSNYATIQVKDTLARVKGVGDVTFLGPRDYSMRVWLDPQKLAARNMTASDVVRAIKEQNLQVAAGRLGQPPAPTGLDFQLTLNTQGRLAESNQFEQIVVKTGDKGAVTYLRDVARNVQGVELGAKNYDVSSYLDGQPAATLAVFQLPGSNALDTANAVRKEMDKLAERFPAGVEYRIVYDTTVFVSESIHDVYKTLFEAIILVLIVVLVFLQNWRATIIPMIAVPVSLIGTFAVMAALGFSLNNLSLFGLVLAIGIVVDDAIVVVENVERNMSLGLNPRDASIKAMDEVTGPVVAIGLVLTAVFVPTAIISGITGQFYRQFALTIAASTLISVFNSLTLSPALCALMLKPHGSKKDPLELLLDSTLGWFFRGFNKFFDWTITGYGRAVGILLRLSVIVLLVYGGLIALTYLGFKVVPTGFIPQQDKGYLVVNAQLPDGASLDRTEDVMKRITNAVLETEGVEHAISVPGYSVLISTNLPNVGGMFVIMKPFEERKGNPELSGPAIMARLQKQFREIQEAKVVVFGAPPVDGLGTTGGFKLQVQDKADLGLPALQGAVDNMVQAGNQQPGLAGLFTSFSTNQPQLYVDVDRVKAKGQNVALTDVFDTLQSYLGSAYVNDFTRFGRNWQVYVQADARFRLRPEDIGNLKVRNASGDMVPLSTIVDVKDSSGPAIVNHYNMFPSAEVNGNMKPGTSSGQAISIMDQLANKELPQSMGNEWTELTLQQILASQDPINKLVFPLAVVFVFIVLAFQYESLSLPLAILLIVPMCLLCAIAGLYLTRLDVNIFTQIGLVVLIGLAAKNAILIVEFAKERQDKEGEDRHTAAVQAAKLRLRPILMTSFAFILGVVPLVLAKGAGAEMRFALGVTVFSGMIGVTVFGIFFTPVFYVVVRWFTERSTIQRHGHKDGMQAAHSMPAESDGHIGVQLKPDHTAT